MPMWSEEETWTCRGFFSLFARQTAESRDFAVVHRRPATRSDSPPTPSDRLGSLLIWAAGVGRAAAAGAHDGCQEWDMLASGAPLDCHLYWRRWRGWAGWSSTGGRSGGVKGARRSHHHHHRLTFMSVHWCFRNILNDNCTQTSLHSLIQPLRFL